MASKTTRSSSTSPPPMKRYKVTAGVLPKTDPSGMVFDSTHDANALPTGSSPSNTACIDADIAAEMRMDVECQNSYDRELDYRNKLVLAPMVRTGSLPMRLLSLLYGAGLVWSPEIVDKAIIGAERSVNEETGVITYSKGSGIIFTTHPIEKPYLIFQIGSSDPKLAVEAAKVVQQDVSGVDLNCGCPKPFSVHSGMGAALLTEPDTLINILRALLRDIKLPISCKIRLLPTQPATVLLAARILKTGIRNLTVHCRTRDMRSGEPAIWDRLEDIVALGETRGVSVICNGDGDGWNNWEKIRARTGASSVMIARAAERNPSIFLPTGALCNVTHNIPKLLNIAEYIDNPWGNTKFLLNQFKPSSSPISNMTKVEKKQVQERISKAKNVSEVAASLGIELGAGKEILRQIGVKMAQESGDIWEDRKEAEEEGVTLDEDSVIETQR